MTNKLKIYLVSEYGTPKVNEPETILKKECYLGNSACSNTQPLAKMIERLRTNSGV